MHNCQVVPTFLRPCLFYWSLANLFQFFVCNFLSSGKRYKGLELAREVHHSYPRLDLHQTGDIYDITQDSELATPQPAGIVVSPAPGRPSCAGHWVNYMEFYCHNFCFLFAFCIRRRWSARPASPVLRALIMSANVVAIKVHVAIYFYFTS